MAPLSAAVARAQLRQLPQRNRRRNENCIYLSKRLEAMGIQTFLAPPDVQRVYFEFVVRCAVLPNGLTLAAFAKALVAEGARVEVTRYPLLHLQPLFTEGHWAKIARIPAAQGGPPPFCGPGALPRTEAGNGALLKLPSFPGADRPLLDQYATAFEKVLSHASRLPR